MRVLFCGMRWSYGDPARGLSHEYTNLFDAMRRMEDVEASLFDFMDAHRAGGTVAVRKGLLDAVKLVDPDLLFCALFEDEVPRDLLADLRDRSRPFTFNWFADDHWRFETFTRRYAPLFNACSTTAASALPKYAAIGYDAVVKTQWAANPHMYRPVSNSMRHDVTFVGQAHGDRPAVLETLRREGLPVQAWGRGWPTGEVDHERMIEIFSTSRINLNLSNASTAGGPLRRIGRRLGLIQTLSQQIKGRNFEIPACGGFQLSGMADDLEDYYDPGKEIVLFDTAEELVDRARKYLANEDERVRIARAGYRRTLAEHTYAHRFRDIFDAIDVQYASGGG